MSALREAAQQALEASEQRLPLVGQATIIDELNALRAALTQEPVAWLYRGNLHHLDPSDWASEPATPLYATPPRRTMVPLTEEEIQRIHLHLCDTVGSSYKTVARAIEKASWEKNNGQA